MRRLNVFAVFALCACGLGMVWAPARAAESPAEVSFAIPSQPLSSALITFSKQAHVQVLMSSGARLGATQSPGVTGTYAVSQALSKLLQGTGFTGEFTDASTVVIKPLSTARSRSSSSSQRSSKSRGQALYTLGTITVKGTAESLTATRTETPLREIPQSVSIISQETLNQQNATDVTSALKFAPGIQMVQDTSQDTYIYSRGFLVDSVHIDGGAPNRVNLGGVGVTSLDLAEFDGLEVLRGSDALFGGMGNPSATVSLHRKEPTPDFQASVDTSIGSWDQYRFVGDVSGPLNSSGTLSGRLVVSGQNQDYFYNIADLHKRFIYGILKYDLGSSTTLEFGGSYQTNNGINNFEGLPRYDTGADPHLPRSLALTAPWAIEENSFTEFFAKFDHHFNDNWRLRINATQLYQRTPEDTSAGYEGPISSATGLLTGPLAASVGLGGYDNQQTLDATMTGSFDWLGQKQQVMFGFDYQHEISPGSQFSLYPSGPTINPFAFDPALYPAPVLSPGNIEDEVTTSLTVVQRGFYGAFRFHPTKNLALLVGGRLSDYHENFPIYISVPGYPAFPPIITDYTDSNKFTPYAGITYDLGPHYTLYASFADIYFTSSGEQTKEHGALAPANGDTSEAGIKGSWFGNTLNASLALFKEDQIGIGTLDPTVPANYTCCFIPESIQSKGFEATLSGLITAHWQLSASYTYNIHQAASAYFVTTLPRNLFKLWTNYQLPGAWHSWSIGGGLLAQTANRDAECIGYNADGSCAQFASFHQGSYVVPDLRVAYMFNHHWSASLSLNNIFDRNYYQTLGQLELGNWYGAPRNYVFKLMGKF